MKKTIVNYSSSSSDSDSEILESQIQNKIKPSINEKIPYIYWNLFRIQSQQQIMPNIHIPLNQSSLERITPIAKINPLKPLSLAGIPIIDKTILSSH